MNRVHNLYRSCSKYAHYNNADRHAITQAMEDIDLLSLGESEETLPRDVCEYVEIAGNDSGFQIALFKIPAGHRIPLHDHPGMTVFSKILYGAVEVHSYDVKAKTIPAIGEILDASVVESGEVWTERSGVHITSPNAGNLHEMRAITTACLLDGQYCIVQGIQFTCGIPDLDACAVLTPPYGDFGSERDCSYFEVASRHGNECTLRRVNCPRSFFTLNAPYHGPPVCGSGYDEARADPSFLRLPSDGEPIVPHLRYEDNISSFPAAKGKGEDNKSDEKHVESSRYGQVPLENEGTGSDSLLLPILRSRSL